MPSPRRGEGWYKSMDRRGSSEYESAPDLGRAEAEAVESRVCRLGLPQTRTHASRATAQRPAAPAHAGERGKSSTGRAGAATGRAGTATGGPVLLQVGQDGSAGRCLGRVGQCYAKQFD